MYLLNIYRLISKGSLTCICETQTSQVNQTSNLFTCLGVYLTCVTWLVRNAGYDRRGMADLRHYNQQGRQVQCSATTKSKANPRLICETSQTSQVNQTANLFT
jgi:hypothetical protein